MKTKYLSGFFLLVGLIFLFGCTPLQSQQTCRDIQVPYEEEEVYTDNQCEYINFGVRSMGDFEVFISEDSTMELIQGNTFRVTTTYKSNTDQIFTNSFFPECFDEYGTIRQGSSITQKFGAYEQLDVSATVNLAGLDGIITCSVLAAPNPLEICKSVEKTKTVTKYKIERVCQ